MAALMSSMTVRPPRTTRRPSMSTAVRLALSAALEFIM
jgi:hypothetical protein